MTSKQLPFKVILCGESSVGKTTLLGKLSGLADYKPEQTMSCNFCNITTQHDGIDVNMNLWDTAGQEQYRSLVKIYFLGADVVIYVCDLSSKVSLKSLEFWIEEVSKNTDVFPAGLIVANKNDLIDDIKVTENDLNNLSKTHKLKWMKVSANSGENLSFLKNEIAKICINNGGNIIIDELLTENSRWQNQNISNVPINLNEQKKKRICC